MEMHLFGSRMKGTASRFSDWDVYCEMQPPIAMHPKEPLHYYWVCALIDALGYNNANAFIDGLRNEAARRFGATPDKIDLFFPVAIDGVSYICRVGPDATWEDECIEWLPDQGWPHEIKGGLK